jgi:hypothetical protein
MELGDKMPLLKLASAGRVLYQPVEMLQKSEEATAMAGNRVGSMQVRHFPPRKTDKEEIGGRGESRGPCRGINDCLTRDLP